MEKLEGYNSRIKRLSELVAQLEQGELSLDELSEMEAITRELHERSIILRYNAFKDKVIGIDETEDEEMEGVEVEVIIEELDDDEADVSHDEEESTSPESEAEPMIDFSIFDEPEVVEEKKEEESTPPVPEPTPIVETPAPEPVIEKTPEPIVEAPVAVEEEPTPEPEPVKEASVASNSAAQSFLDRLQVEDDSVASRFSAGKLDSLIGAFGLNQRLRYINDLFDGSSEIFSDAIKSLDSQSSLNDANQKAAQLATDHEWDPEEEVVVEFMTFVHRRYA
jgi:hypothetical protein